MMIRIMMFIMFILILSLFDERRVCISEGNRYSWEWGCVKEKK